MSRPKGGKNKYWTKKEKMSYVTRMLSGESSAEIMRSDGVNSGMLRNWLKKYNDGGEAALENKRKPGNPLVKYQGKKNLTELEQLQYENMKLKIENLRLKKGYTNEEAVKARQERLSKKNMK